MLNSKYSKINIENTVLMTLTDIDRIQHQYYIRNFFFVEAIGSEREATGNPKQSLIFFSLSAYYEYQRHIIIIAADVLYIVCFIS